MCDDMLSAQETLEQCALLHMCSFASSRQQFLQEAIMKAILLTVAPTVWAVCSGMAFGTPAVNRATIPHSCKYDNDLKNLDTEAVSQDLADLMLNSQECWPADWGNCGPFFVRLFGHCSRSHHETDGCICAGLGPTHQCRCDFVLPAGTGSVSLGNLQYKCSTKSYNIISGNTGNFNNDTFISCLQSDVRLSKIFKTTTGQE